MLSSFKYVIMEGNSKVSIRIVDTDVILLAINAVQCLVEKLWAFKLGFSLEVACEMVNLLHTE